MRTIDDLPTPCLLLEQDVLQRNLDRMSAIAKSGGVDLRPHCKTAKSAEVARRATANHSGAIAVSTLHEAEYFQRHGFTDILYAVGMVPSRLPRVAELQRHGANITVIVDSEAMAQELSARMATLPKPLPVLIEIDAELHRTGVPADSNELIQIGKILDESASLELAGILAFGGIGYSQDTVAGIADAAERVRVCAVTAAERLRAAGLPCEVVSIGATPTRLAGGSLEGVTEIRPGVYVFMDLMQQTLGVCGFEDIAVTVLATVIGHNRDEQRMYIDAGALALSKDLGLARPGALHADYGLLRIPNGTAPFEDIGVTNVNQEHGFVSRVKAGAPFPFEKFPLDSRVRILPNHVCHTIASYDRYYVIDAEGQVVDEWDRDIGW
jgi:D-serine deaminase-like pyridoxal phosphate-dependent protein